MGAKCYRLGAGENQGDYEAVTVADSVTPPLISVVNLVQDRICVGDWYAAPPVEQVRRLVPENDYACWQAGEPLVCSQVLGWRVFEAMLAATGTGESKEVREMVGSLYQPSNFLILPVEADQRFRAAENSLCTAIDAYEQIKDATVLSHKWSSRASHYIEKFDFQCRDAVYVASTILRHYPTLQPLYTVTGDRMMWHATIDQWVRILEFLSRLD